MNTLPSTPAAALLAACQQAERALVDLHARGIPVSSVLELAKAATTLEREIGALPAQIAVGGTPYCEGCPHAGLEVIYNEGEHPICTICEPLECPAVKAVGFLSDSDLDQDIPPAFRRQAS